MHIQKCPACPRLFTRDSQIQAVTELVEHLCACGDEDHARHREIWLLELERLIGLDSPHVRPVLLSKCVEIDEHLKAIHLLAASTLALSFEKLRELISCCDGTASVTKIKAAKNLLKNLRECIVIVGRRYHQ